MIMTFINKTFGKVTSQLTFADGVIVAIVLYSVWYFADVISKYYNTAMMMSGF